MKKLLLLLLLGLAPNLVMAQTAKAIWCAGNSTLYFTYDNTTYSAGGTYDGQTITNVYTVDGNGYSYYTNRPWDDIRESVTYVVIASNFYQFKPTSIAYWFHSFTNLTNITGSNYLNTRNVTEMSGTFCVCSSLTSLNLSNWDTSNVTALQATFSGCSSLTSLDVSNWDTSNVTDMGSTFYNCSSLASLDVSNWNTSNVTILYATFSNCRSLTSLDVSNWNTSNVIGMNNTFKGCSSLTSLNVSNWDTSNVTTLYDTFCYCYSLTSLDLSNWKTSKVTTLYETFNRCSSLTSLDVSNWDTSNVTTLYYTFGGCESLTSLDLSNWDTSNVTTMQHTFYGCSSLTSLDLNNWNTSNVRYIGYAFYGCSNLTNVTFGKDFSTSKVVGTYNRVFCDCSHLRYIDFYDSDDTDAITKLDNPNMFMYLPSTTIIYLPHGSQIVTDRQNVVYSYNGDETDLRCPNYYSEDKVDIELPRAFKTNRAEYSRDMSSTYGSVVLPYDFTSNSDIQAYTLDEEHVGSMTFKNATTVPAHTPFAFQKLASGTTAPFVMEDATGNFGITVQAAHDTKDNPYTATTNLTGWTTKGYYAAQTVDDYSDAFYISGDKIYKADGPLTLYPHRVTFHGTWTQGTPGTGAKNLEIADMATCITPIDNSQLTIDNCYDLSGRRVQSNKVTGSQSNMLPKGIYIVNGKKMVVK